MSVFVLSDESINFYGFKVKTKGIDLSRFTDNPVMLYEHTPSYLLGRWLNVKIDKAKLVAEPEFDEDDEFAMQKKKKVEKGYLKGASIGIHIVEIGNEVGENNELIPVVTKCILMEASLVAVPANQFAIKLYAANGNPLEGDELENTIKSLSVQATTQVEIPNSNSQMKLSAFILTALGLKEGFSEADLESSVSNLHAENVRLKAQLSAINQAEIDSLINAAITEGRLTAGQKEHYQSLAASNLELFKSILSGLPVPTKPTDEIEGDGGNADLGIPADRIDWTLSTWMQKDAKGLHELRAKNPTAYADIVAKRSNMSH